MQEEVVDKLDGKDGRQGWMAPEEGVLDGKEEVVGELVPSSLLY